MPEIHKIMSILKNLLNLQKYPIFGGKKRNIYGS